MTNGTDGTEPIQLPGVRIERRVLLTIPALAAVIPAALAAAPRAEGVESPLDFEAFTELCGKLAADHLADGRIDPDAYLHALGALGSRLEGAPLGQLGAFGGYEPKIEIAPIHRATPIFVIQWRLAPGAFFPPHNHTPAYVYSLCLEGACWVRHFEIVGDAPAPGAEGTFEMRKTHARLLRPGLGTSLTPERDNIHTFTAGPEGALGIDINTSIGGKGDWSMLEYEEAKREGFDKRYEARWIGKP